MKTITDIYKQITNPKSFMQQLCETLRIIDPEFIQEETKFMAAKAKLEQVLGSSTKPSVSEYLSAEEALLQRLST